MIRKLIHLLAALQFSYSVYYDWTYVKIPVEISNGTKFGGKFVFLTFWDAIVQAFFFWLCLLNDFIGTNEINPKVMPAIRKFKDHLFCSIAFPLSVFVAVMFWGLYAIDRELVFPKILDSYFPQWLNHVMHTNIVVFSVIELVSSFRSYPTRKEGLGTLTLFMLVYLIWTFIIYFKSGNWVYPVLNVLNWPQRIGFFLVVFLVQQVLYLLGEGLNSIVWSKDLKSSGNKRLSERKKAY